MANILTVEGYKVHISNRLSRLTKVIRSNDFSAIFILVDENTRRWCLPVLRNAVPALKDAFILEILSGEAQKTIETCRMLWIELQKRNADRQSLFINLGGGVIGDLGGFTASAYLRGIPFINIPTTLLAQIDASIGGKLGVDFNGVKNAIGFFKNPAAVFVHPGFLKTLPDDELLSGFAEMLKHALISSPAMWKEIKKIRDVSSLRDGITPLLIQKSLLVKKKIVEKDPLELNVRKVLNFGHTIGHAFESGALAERKKLLHGHAVALGMIAESHLSSQLTGLPEKQLHEITSFILHHYRKFYSEISDINWLRWIKYDKKSAQGRLNFTLLKSIGKPVVNCQCVEPEIDASVQFLKSKL